MLQCPKLACGTHPAIWHLHLVTLQLLTHCTAPTALLSVRYTGDTPPPPGSCHNKDSDLGRLLLLLLLEGREGDAEGPLQLLALALVHKLHLVLGEGLAHVVCNMAQARRQRN